MKGGPEILGKVSSLHLHPIISGEPLTGTDSIDVVAGKGIVANPRHFDRRSRRQVSLIEREQVEAHAQALGLRDIPPGRVRSNIETSGIDLVALIGRSIRIGEEATLILYEPRRPCAKMDAICHGLRQLMEDNHQGMMAEIQTSGTIRVGDPVVVLDKST